MNQISVGQISSGNYSNEYDYIKFSNDSVCFDLTIYGCLITHIRGCGDYQVKDNYLFIATREYNGEKSTVEKVFNKSDSTDIKVIDKKGEPIIGVMIALIDFSGNMIGGNVTNIEGKAKIKSQPEIDLVQVNYIACDVVDFKFESNFDYTINLAEGYVTEYQTVVFEIISSNTNKLKLKLLDTDFNDKEDKTKSLKRIKRRTKKHNHSINILERKTVTNSK